MNDQPPSEYRAESASQYESQATETAWHGHEILFGLMYFTSVPVNGFYQPGK
ncbi:MAG: hypothetical protein JW908_03430 [Anaerolineales bacterium]|nr:hypothetical protein [Anaerolineales bacterium]